MFQLREACFCNARLFHTPPTYGSATQGKHITRCWLPGISIWLKIKISVTKRYHVLTSIYEHIISSTFQILENMLHSNSVLTPWIRLISVDHADYIIEIGSNAQHSIHETFLYRSIGHQSHLLFLLGCPRTLIPKKTTPCLKCKKPFVELCIANLTNILSMFVVSQQA